MTPARGGIARRAATSPPRPASLIQIKEAGRVASICMSGAPLPIGTQGDRPCV